MRASFSSSSSVVRNLTATRIHLLLSDPRKTFEAQDECFRPVINSSLTGCTLCIVKYFRPRSSFMSGPLWKP